MEKQTCQLNNIFNVYWIQTNILDIRKDHLFTNLFSKHLSSFYYMQGFTLSSLYKKNTKCYKTYFYPTDSTKSSKIISAIQVFFLIMQAYHQYFWSFTQEYKMAAHISTYLND